MVFIIYGIHIPSDGKAITVDAQFDFFLKNSPSLDTCFAVSQLFSTAWT